MLEHMYLFNRIKGVHVTVLQATDLAREVGLEDFLYVAADALSGGNKRKLCVAVALCGDPNFLVLDEPSSGKWIYIIFAILYPFRCSQHCVTLCFRYGPVCTQKYLGSAEEEEAGEDNSSLHTLHG